MSKPVENGWGGVKTTPVVPKNVENGLGGVETTPAVLKQVGTGGIMLKPPCRAEKRRKEVGWC